MTTLNERAAGIAARMIEHADRLRLAVHEVGGVTIIDCGAVALGGLDAGLHLTRLTMGDLGEVTLLPGPAIQVATDDPVRACLACQYAGRPVSVGKYFGMGSGPMRAVLGGEPIFDDIPGREESSVVVGAIESRKLPTAEVVESLLVKLPEGTKLTLAVAPASSIAGTVQVVARALETALHKLHALKFDVNQILSGIGVAPLPPMHPDEIQAIGRTNDAILYGGEVTLYVKCDDSAIEAVGPKVPSSDSKDHGELFANLFARYGDFYKIDPMLFSPAVVTFVNLTTGRAFRYGQSEPALLQRSFFGSPS